MHGRQRVMIASMFMLWIGLLTCGSDTQAVGIGEKAKAFTLESLRDSFNVTGQKVSLEQFRGKIIVLDFWATWCEPYGEELSCFDRLQKKYGKEKVVVVAINVDNEAEPAVQFLKRRRVDLITLWDARKSVAWLYDIPRMPSAFVIDRYGIIRFMHSGFDEKDIHAYESEIENLLNETEIKN